MILSVGIDIADVSRFRAAIERHPRMLERLFTPLEREGLEKKADGASSMAARFSAKEAALKALGCGWGKGVGWTDVEILSAQNGAPVVVLHAMAKEIFLSRGGGRIHVSMTHDGGNAAAVIIIESGE